MSVLYLIKTSLVLCENVRNTASCCDFSTFVLVCEPPFPLQKILHVSTAKNPSCTLPLPKNFPADIIFLNLFFSIGIDRLSGNLLCSIFAEGGEIMQYEIKGGVFPVVVCYLENGEQMITEKGSMVWQSPNVSMETKGGGIGKMFSKAFSGESMFQNIFTAQNGAGMVTFGSSFPGKIIPFAIEPGREIIVQKKAFLAAETGVNLSIFFNQKLGAGFFGGEGFIMQRLSGSGTAFVEIDGEVMEYDLAPGEQLIVDTGNIAGFEAGVKMEIRQVAGLKNKLLGGEGFFNTLLTGPGKVWLQTMPISSVAASIREFIPSGN